MSVYASCIHAASYPSSKFSKLSMSTIFLNKETAVNFLKVCDKIQVKELLYLFISTNMAEKVALVKPKFIKVKDI